MGPRMTPNEKHAKEDDSILDIVRKRIYAETDGCTPVELSVPGYPVQQQQQPSFEGDGVRREPDASLTATNGKMVHIGVPVKTASGVGTPNDSHSQDEEIQPGAHAMGGPAPSRIAEYTAPSAREPLQDEETRHVSGQTSQLESARTAEAGSEAGLVMANPVEDDTEVPDHTIPRAQSVNLSRRRRKQLENKNWRYWFLVIILIALVALVVTIPLAILWLEKKKDASTSTLSDPRAIAIRNRIDIAVHNDTAAAFQNVFSPQSQALNWILYDDPEQLQAEDERLLQRYGAALFYYETTEKAPWGACNPTEVDELTQEPCYYTGHLGDGLWGSDGYAYRVSEHLAFRWLSAAHECHWAGLFCNSQKQVESLQLDAMNLTGTFPLELPQLLPELRVLSLTANELYGELPASAPEWKRLSSLNLHRNLFTGNIPSEWLDSRMEKLELLGLAYNPLTIGSLPPEIGTLTDLKYLFLEETHVSGTIPEELYQLTNLERTLLARNFLTGTLATEMGLLSRLDMFSISHSRITGTLPSEVGLLTSMREFDAFNTKIGGSIPEELFSDRMKLLNVIILSQCQFTGTISPSIGNLPGLGYFLLAKNTGIVGTIPAELALLPLRRLDIDGTNLTGSMPDEVCALRGDNFLYRVKADCATLSTGVTPISCPDGCCTKCCDQDTRMCRDMAR